jgi:hypothetical protein
MTNAINLMQPLGDDWQATLRAIDDFYALKDGREEREVLLFSAWPTPDLRAHGWTLAGHPPVHLLPARASRRPRPASLEIQRVTDRAGLDDFERIMIDGYPFSGLTAGALFGTSLLNDESLRFWVGYEHGRAVSAALACADTGINNVMLITTLPEARGKGFGEALTWEASLLDPALPAMLLSSDLGRPVYERMGYLPLFRYTLWYRNRP